MSVQYCYKCVMPALSESDWTCDYCENYNTYDGQKDD
jgi:hypothetical protein